MDRPDWPRRLRFALRAVVRRRCPKCGRGRAFAGFWSLRPACPECGRRFQRHPGSITGVMQVGALAVVLFAIAAWYLIDALADFPLDASLALMLSAAVLFGLFFYPYAKLLWEAIDCLLDEMSDEET